MNDVIKELYFTNNAVKNLILENSDVINYDPDQIYFDCLVILKTEPNGINLKINYKGIKQICGDNQTVGHSISTDFIPFKDNEEIYLIKHYNILGIKFDNEKFVLTKELDDTNKKLKDEIRTYGTIYDKITKLIEQKRQILDDLGIDYSSTL